MITRTWHGRTKISDADNYLDFLRTKGTNEYSETPGNISVKVQKKEDGDFCHFWTVTEWRDWDSIRLFTGADAEKAKYYPEDKQYLLEFEEHVDHVEAFELTNVKVKRYIQQLDLLYSGGNWLGESLMEKLSGINDDAAFYEPFEGWNSIAALVWHCQYWRMTLIKRLEGDHGYRDATVAEKNFLRTDKLQERGWYNLVQDLQFTQDKIIEYLSDKHDPFLSEEFAQGYTFEYFIEGIIEHDAYHLGQIGLLIKMYNNRS